MKEPLIKPVVGVPLRNMTVSEIAHEALTHVKEGDTFGLRATHPTTIRTRALLEWLAIYAIAMDVTK